MTLLAKFLSDDDKAQAKKIIKELLVVARRYKDGHGPWMFYLAVAAMQIVMDRETAERTAAGDEEAESDREINNKLAAELADEIDKPLAKA